MPTDDELSVTFAALSDPTRRAILARLAGAKRPSSNWVEDYRAIWEERFGRLDEYLRELQQRDAEKVDIKE